MAPAGKFFSFLFLASLLFSQQTQARESKFSNFSKFTTVNNNNVKESEVPQKETPVNKQEQEPAFIPETQGAYGLYGHESGQFPPTTTTTTNGVPATTTTTTTVHVPATTTPNVVPYTTTATSNNLPYTTEAEKEQNNNYQDTYSTQYNPSKANYYYNGNKNYESNPNGMSDTRLTQSSYTTTTTTPTNYPNSNNYYNGATNSYNLEKQGMSDTRFLENGKYYYDPNSRPNNYNQNQYGNSRVVDSRNWYNNRGNYGNNNENHNTYNSMEGYQNEEEFQESDDQFVP